MDIVRQSLAIAFVFALLWALLWLLRKKGRINMSLGKAAPSRLLVSQDKLALSAQHTLHCIRAGERQFVLATHPSGIAVVCELTGSGSERPGSQQ
jgi:flagellar biogenesis protein FliO